MPKNKTWDEFEWPDWVPQIVIKEIEGFWSHECGRGPEQWVKDAEYAMQHYYAPPFGARGVYCRTLPSSLPVYGRYIHAWNNIGRVVDNDGNVYLVSSGRPMNVNDLQRLLWQNMVSRMNLLQEYNHLQIKLLEKMEKGHNFAIGVEELIKQISKEECYE